MVIVRRIAFPHNSSDAISWLYRLPPRMCERDRKGLQRNKVQNKVGKNVSEMGHQIPAQAQVGDEVDIMVAPLH